MLFHGVDLPSCAGLAAAQGAAVALPRRGAVRAGATTAAWIVPPALFVATVIALARWPAGAKGLAIVALVAVPVLAGGAVTALHRHPRPAALLVVPALVALALAVPGRLAGQCAILALLTLSCVALAALLCRYASPRSLALGIAVLSLADVVLVRAGTIDAAAQAISSVRLGELPGFTQAMLGNTSLGYGDLLVAGISGSIVARLAGSQWRAAALTVLLMLGEAALLAGAGQMYPATVPVALALFAEAAWLRARRAGLPTTAVRSGAIAVTSSAEA